ncbi:MAG: beta-N-acetylhexosaminidase, partial [Anaerolineae bacterium]
MPDLLLLPQPRLITITDGYLSPADRRLIVLDGPEPAALRFSAGRLQAALREKAGLHWEIVAGNTVPHDQVGVTLSVVEGGTRHPQGYELTITTEGIHAVASTPAGIFYAVCTLIQLLEPASREQLPGVSRLGPARRHREALKNHQLPTLRISDWPDFPNRGVMLDVSRDRVPTMETLFGLVDLLASWKINQLQLYTEHTFAYRNHPEVWAEASPFTGEEIMALDAYCRERFIELVPNQNSFGHMTRWLIHDRYRHLAEAPNGCDTRWGHYDVPLSLCPIDPGSIELVRSMYDELLPHFSSRQINVGCDETIDLGLGRSKEAVATQGIGRVYLDFLLKIYREVKARGRTMQFWGDIIMEHPELVPELPRDVIALEWGYEPDHPFDEHGRRFAESGVPFYVCPGTGTWNTVAGRTKSALENLRNAAMNGIRNGAIGYLITDWGDAGHWQPLPVSYLGFAWGAALSWT